MYLFFFSRDLLFNLLLNVTIRTIDEKNNFKKMTDGSDCRGLPVEVLHVKNKLFRLTVNDTTIF